MHAIFESLHAAGRTARRSTRRSSTSPGRSRCSATGSTIGRPDPRRHRRRARPRVLGRRRARTSSSPRWRRSRPSRGRGPNGVEPGPGVVEVVPGRRARLPPPAAGAPAVGCRPVHATTPRAGSGSPRSATSRAFAERAARHRSARPSAAACWSSPAGSTTGRSRVERPVKSIRHEETFAVRPLRPGRPRTRAGAPGRRRGHSAAGERARRPHDLAEGPRRDVRHASPGRARCPRAVDTAPAIVDVVRPR